MKQTYLSIDDIEKIISKFPEEKPYKNLTLSEIEKAINDYCKKPFYNEERKITVVTWQGGYDLFCEAMRKEGEKYLNKKPNGKSS